MTELHQLAAASERAYDRMGSALAKLETEVMKLVADGERLQTERDTALADNKLLRARIEQLEHELRTEQSRAAMRDAFGL